MRLLRTLFARTHRKRPFALQIELLEARLVPAVLSSQQQQLNSYWSDKLADINPPEAAAAGATWALASARR
jgi:hypothetical protein